MTFFHPTRKNWNNHDALLGYIILMLLLALISFFLTASFQNYLFPPKGHVSYQISSSIEPSQTSKSKWHKPLLAKIQTSQLEKGLNELFTSTNGYSEIPSGTELLGVTVQDHTVIVNLSEEFTSGGGSTSMIGRLEELKKVIGKVDRHYKLKLEINGKSVEYLGGEGLELE